MATALAAATLVAVTVMGADDTPDGCGLAVLLVECVPEAMARGWGAVASA